MLDERVTVHVQTGRNGYDVRVGAGGIDELTVLLPRLAPAHRYVVIADDRVASIHGEYLLGVLARTNRKVDLLTFPSGETYKSRETWSDLSDRMTSSGVGRDAAVLAFGGGVAGDLGGFVAATYMRGLPVVQVPTTLLAMIDSSVGGKTGVDTPAGKNLIGAFLQPRLVVADTNLLRTLPAAELRAGLAEAIKHGAIADAAYFDWISDSVEAILACERAAVARLVARSVEIKADVVGKDETESGPRKMLNFGHTIGHAVESLSEFRLLHGEAIAIGMVLEARLGERLGVTEPGTTERLAEVFSRVGLPTELAEDLPHHGILEATRSDKKARQGKVEYSLIERIGRASPASGTWALPVEDALVLAALEVHPAR
jgi:3-dehydroquinate synthase